MELAEVTTNFASALASGDLAKLIMAVEGLKRHCISCTGTNRQIAMDAFRTFPSYVVFKEIAAGRDVIAVTTRGLFEELERRFTLECTGLSESERNQIMTGAWGLFMDGFTSSTVMPSALRERILAKGAAFGCSGSQSVDGGGFDGGGSGKIRSSNGSGGGGGGGLVLGGGGNGVNTSIFPFRSHPGKLKLCMGFHFPFSTDLLGPTIGQTPRATTCSRCFSTSHFRGECPLDWADNGRPLPGFSRNGKRLVAKWNGAEPKRATFVEWLNFIADKHNFPGVGSPAMFVGAPGLSEFRDRAKKALP